MAWSALARMTAADAVRQPVTWLMTAVSLALIALSYGFGLFNFDPEDRLRMLATAGVAIALIDGLFLAVVLASQAVQDELSSRTALTLFAKPLGRGQFLAGKAAGVWLAVAASCLVVAAAHAGALAVAGATGFEDAHDHGDHTHAPTWDTAIAVPWAPVIAAHALGLGHAAALVAVATVLALRLGLVANILACFGVFLLGHLLPASGIMGAGPLPALAVFQLDDAIQLSLPVSGAYLAMTGLYTALFCAGWLCIGLAVFERQDIP